MIYELDIPSRLNTFCGMVAIVEADWQVMQWRILQILASLFVEKSRFLPRIRHIHASMRHLFAERMHGH